MNANELLSYEQWRPVVSYENNYEVSNLGRVKSVGRVGRPGRRGIMKAFPSRTGYQRVSLVLNGKIKSTYVHALVCEAFIGPRPKGHEVDHIDGDKRNNVLLNLRYISHRDNICGMIARLKEEGRILQAHQAGEDHPRAKLKTDQVIEIRQLHQEGKLHLPQIGQMFGVRPETVGKIARRECWKHV
jgi:hypothetical protein